MTDEPPKINLYDFIKAVAPTFTPAPWQRELIDDMQTMTEAEREGFARTMRRVERDARRAMLVRIDADAKLMFSAPVVYEDPRDPREPFPGVRMFGP